MIGQRRGHIGAQHVERPMRDVDDAGDAEDQRKPGGDEEQARGGGEPVERLKQEAVQAHRAEEASCRRSIVTPSPAALRAATSPRWGEGERTFQNHVNNSPSAMRRGGSAQSVAGRSFLTSASEGRTEAPSTYLKSTMIGLPSLTAILPT